MNTFDVKKTVEEVKKQTARDIIRELHKMICEFTREKDFIFNNYMGDNMSLEVYQHRADWLSGSIDSLEDAIENIEDMYEVGPRYVLADSNLE